MPEPTPEPVRYCVYQLEKSPSTGKLHWQGFVRLGKNVRFQGMRKMLELPDSTHCEKARGTDVQNRTYCMKEDSRVSEHEANFCELLTCYSIGH